MPTAQIIELVIFGVLAAVVLYNLYAVIGRRMGRQPTDAAATPEVGAAPDGKALEPPPATDVELSGLAALKARDQAFDLDKFMQGARSAYETIVKAFAAGDRETLKGLLSEPVMAAFNKGILAREAEGRTESAEFIHPPRADIEESAVEEDIARIRVRFLAEFTSRTGGPDGAHEQERRTAEAWTFERNLTSRDPNWTLVRVDAAEA